MMTEYEKLMQHMYGDGFVRPCCFTCARRKKVVEITGTFHRCGRFPYDRFHEAVIVADKDVCQCWACSAASARTAIRIAEEVASAREAMGRTI